MEGVAVDNLIDFDLPSDATAHSEDGGQHQGHTDIFSQDPASSVGVQQQQPLLPEPMAPTKSSSHHHRHHHHHQEEGENESDATESADSENDMDPTSQWELRRSSSSSAHSGEDADAETVERRQFMKAYVEKVFHGK